MNCPYCKYKVIEGSKKGTKPKNVVPCKIEIVYCNRHKKSYVQQCEEAGTMMSDYR